MAKAHPRPTEKTAKELYGNAFVCGFPGCKEPLYVKQPDQTKRSLNSRMAHICARREGGPRWDPAMNANDNRSPANLILLCLKHADEVDLPENIDRYPAELLRQWKAEQMASHDGVVEGWDLSDEEAAEVVAASTDPSVTLQAETIFVGGIGGLAPGASGGGGGAIGPGSIGGPGGPVGRIKLDGLPGATPGTGGGGGGVVAPDAILPTADPAATEGQGFSSGTDGQDGGATTMSIDGVELVRVEGGEGGLTGTGVRRTDSRLAVSALMLVNYAEVREGLVSIVGGGWQSLSVLNLPTPVTFPVYVLFEAPGVGVGEYTTGVEVRGPEGTPRQRLSFPVTVKTAGDVVRIPRCCSLTAEIDIFGLWTLAVVTPDRELAHIDLLVKRTGQA